MNRMTLLLGTSPWKKKSVLSAAFGITLLFPLAVEAQAESEGEGEAAPTGEALAEESPPDEVDVSGDEAVDETESVEDEGLSEADAEDPGDSSLEGDETSEPEPSEDEAVVPEVEEPIDPVGPDDDVGADEEPDYFGSYEPLSGPMVTETAAPKKPPYSGPFRSGAFRVGLGIGGGGYGDQTYLILGGGLGYFPVNGLELHFDTDFWLIGDPFIATPTPGVRYIMWFIPKVHPYVGGFFRHYVVGSGYQDADSVGARGGVYLMTGRSSYFGLGIVYEHMLQDHLFVETDFWYPEISFAFSF